MSKKKTSDDGISKLAFHEELNNNYITREGVKGLSVPGMHTVRLASKSDIVKASRMLQKPIIVLENSRVLDGQGGTVAEGVDSYYVIDGAARYMYIGNVMGKDSEDKK